MISSSGQLGAIEHRGGHHCDDQSVSRGMGRPFASCMGERKYEVMSSDAAPGFPEGDIRGLCLGKLPSISAKSRTQSFQLCMIRYGGTPKQALRSQSPGRAGLATVGGIRSMPPFERHVSRKTVHDFLDMRPARRSDLRHRERLRGGARQTSVIGGSEKKASGRTITCADRVER